MAQVTMTDTEYLELIRKARLYDEQATQTVSLMNIIIDSDIYSGYAIAIPKIIPIETRQAIAEKVVEEITTSAELMRRLVDTDQHVLDTNIGIIQGRYISDKGDPVYVDLLKFPAFKEAWDTVMADEAQEGEEDDK